MKMNQQSPIEWELEPFDVNELTYVEPFIVSEKVLIESKKKYKKQNPGAFMLNHGPSIIWIPGPTISMEIGNG